MLRIKKHQIELLDVICLGNTNMDEMQLTPIKYLMSLYVYAGKGQRYLILTSNITLLAKVISWCYMMILLRC